MQGPAGIQGKGLLKKWEKELHGVNIGLPVLQTPAIGFPGTSQAFAGGILITQ